MNVDILLLLQNFSAARKSGNISYVLKAFFFVRNSSEYEMSDSHRKVIQNYIARCGYTWLDESNWPQEWPINTLTIFFLEDSKLKNESFLFAQDWAVSLVINRFQNT